MIRVDFHQHCPRSPVDPGVVDDSVDGNDTPDQSVELRVVKDIEFVSEHVRTGPGWNPVSSCGMNLPSSMQVRVNQTKTDTPARPNYQHSSHSTTVSTDQ